MNLQNLEKAVELKAGLDYLTGKRRDWINELLEESERLTNPISESINRRLQNDIVAVENKIIEEHSEYAKKL